MELKEIEAKYKELYDQYARTNNAYKADLLAAADIREILDKERKEINETNRD